MPLTIPKKVLVAIPDFSRSTLPHRIVPPEQALVSAFDRSFHFGDSIYEVIRTYNGVLFEADGHLRRLQTSLRMAEFKEKPESSAVLDTIVRTTRAFYQQFGNCDVYIRVIVSRGVSDLNIDADLASDPYYVVYVKEISSISAESYSKGVHLSVVDRRRNPPSALDPAMKSGNYLNNVLALNEAKRLGGIDAILLSTQGFVTEATTSNIFAVKDGVVWTAPLSVGILAGITRDWVIETCHEQKVQCEEKLFTGPALLTCDEVFLSSSLKEIMPITQLNRQPVGNGKPGAVTEKLRKALRQRIENWCKSRAKESLYI